MFRVCLDPGHGGSDPGAIGPNGAKEKDINLAVVKLVATHLKRHGIQVRLTLEIDQYVSRAGRCKISNDFGADVFVSIHCNAAENRSARGVETWHYSTKGRQLAEAIQTELVQATGLVDRNQKADKRKGFDVLVGTQAVAALTELAFISNPEEERLLTTPTFQKSVAEAIAKGICRYLGVEWVPEKRDLSTAFPDIVNHWAKKEIQAVAEEGLLAGYPDGKFYPDEPVTRAQLAVVLFGLLRGGF